jgi:hypothetical protein
MLFLSFSSSSSGFNVPTQKWLSPSPSIFSLREVLSLFKKKQHFFLLCGSVKIKNNDDVFMC